MSKLKPNKGLLKRIRITKSGKVIYNRAFGRHLRSHKPGSQLRKYRRPKQAHASDIGRIRGMLHLPVARTAEPAKKQEETQ